MIVIWLWPPAYLTLTVDDSFYYLRIAEHIAQGAGPTFDGVERTNGFHPLWMAISTLLALLPLDPADAMRLALSVNVVLVRACLALFGHERPRVELVGALLMTNFWFTKVFVNGMESSLVALLIAACWLAPKQARWSWGLVAGALILARLDAVLFVLPWLVRRPRAAIGVAAVTLPWAVASWLWFGHLLPVSAAVKFGGVPLEAIVVASVALAGAWLPKVERSWPIAAYAVALFVVGGWFEIWRLVPLALIATLGVASVRPRVLRPVVGAYALVSVVTWVHRFNPASYAPYLAARRAGQWLRAHTPADAVVAGWDCGIVAAHSERRFFQLQGLVGSWAFFEIRRAGKTDEYIRSRGVRWIAQSMALDEPELVIEGVDLSSWTVEHSECAEFRSIVSPRTPRRLLWFIVRRPGAGMKLADLVSSDDPCATRASAPAARPPPAGQ